MNEQSLFAQVLDIPDPAERAAFLARACGGDAALRRRLDRLLERHHDAGSFLERVPDLADATVPYAQPEPAEAPGTRLGPYQLLEVVGEGGMGAVYMADQFAPVRRRVAVKVIKPGMDSSQVVARFEAERQALALMDHPHIARVFDAGATPTGRPYFVMELVRGLPATDYCDQAKLPVRDRLALFAQVCRAVQHAHQKGVIHRDLKPSNVLVTVIDGRPVAKVIDFGIAKAAGAALTDRTLVTGFHQMVGTPLYMSPEQAELSGVDVDTRSDVYSLGVLLYELLTGTTPFDRERFRSAGLDEVRRIIREDEPPRPSRRVSTLSAEQCSTVAERRGVDSRRLGRLMRGELDWVVMRCLEKDRARRYDGAGALAADVDRYLADEPVQAAPPTFGYRLRKFARRHRTGLAVGAVLVAAVLAVAGSLGWTAWDRSTRRTIAEAAAATALEESAEHYRADRPDAAMASAKRAVDTLTGVPGAEGALADARQRVTDLEMSARLEHIWLEAGDSFRNVGRDGVATLFHALFREHGLDPSEEPVDVLAARIRDRVTAPALVGGLDEWAKNRRKKHGSDDPLAARLSEAADAADPNPWSHRVRAAVLHPSAADLMALANRIEVESTTETAVVHLSLALLNAGREGEAETLLLRTARTHPDRVRVYRVLGDLCRSSPLTTRRVETLGYYRAALALRPRSPTLMTAIGVCLSDELGRYAEAADVFREAVRVAPDYPYVRKNLASVLLNQDKHVEALVEAREAVRLDPGASSYQILGSILAALGKKAEAAEAYENAARFTADDTATSHHHRGNALHTLGRLDEAAREYREAIRLRPWYANALTHLGHTLYEQNKPSEAVPLYQAALRARPDTHPAAFGLGEVYRVLGEVDQAIAAFRTAVALKPGHAPSHAYLGGLLDMTGKTADAVRSLQRAIQLDPTLAYAHYNLGNALRKRGEADAAVESYLTAVRLDPDHAEAHCNLGQSLKGLGRYRESLKALRTGHEIGSKRPGWKYPSAQWIKECEALVAKEDADRRARGVEVLPPPRLAD